MSIKTQIHRANLYEQALLLADAHSRRCNTILVTNGRLSLIISHAFVMNLQIVLVSGKEVRSA